MPQQERQERFITEQVQAGYGVDGLYLLGPGWRDKDEHWRDTRPQATAGGTQ